MWKIILSFFSIVIILTQITYSIAADDELGTCFRLRFKGNKCGHPVRTLVSRKRCCAGSYKRAWSSYLWNPGISNQTNELNSEIKGLNRAMFSECESCASHCHQIQCPNGQKCVIRSGLPKCVCSPRCHLKHKALVCGTDGRTYSSECQILKRACRKSRWIGVAHTGSCQSCTGVRCEKDKRCVLDEFLKPICMDCLHTCKEEDPSQTLCGVDGVTFSSQCLLKKASCETGVMIKKAYKGACIENATCSQVTCWKSQKCLSSIRSGRPQCSSCSSLFERCLPRLQLVCSLDGSSFPSWCAFHMEACRSGKALTPIPLHYCTTNDTKNGFSQLACRHPRRKSELKFEHKIERIEKLSKRKRNSKEINFAFDFDRIRGRSRGGGGGGGGSKEEVLKKSKNVKRRLRKKERMKEMKIRRRERKRLRRKRWKKNCKRGMSLRIWEKFD